VSVTCEPIEHVVEALTSGLSQSLDECSDQGYIPPQFHLVRSLNPANDLPSNLTIQLYLRSGHLLPQHTQLLVQKRYALGRRSHWPQANSLPC